MLTEKQLQHICNCEEIKCSECSFTENCDCGAKSKVAEMALHLIDILKQIEWQGVNSWGMERRGCPICGNEQEEGHKVDCILSKALIKG